MFSLLGNEVSVLFLRTACIGPRNLNDNIDRKCLKIKTFYLRLKLLDVYITAAKNIFFLT